jgi:hypothetical protein
MASGITFKNLFGLYYNLYRGEATPPATTDDEWPIAIRNYNDALYRIQSADDTKWNWLFTTLQSSTQISPALVRTLALSTTTYVAPQDMLEPGGQFTLTDSAGNMTNYPIVQPYQNQALNDNDTYGFFTGDRMNGFTFHINPTPTAANGLVGLTLDYTYYRKPTTLIASTDDGTVETGTSIIEGCDPSYLYNHMLAQRLKVDENWSGYQVAMRDAEEALKNMKLKINSYIF